MTNSKGHPWIDDGFGGRINEAKKAAGCERLHFHDLRDTAATRFYTAGLEERVIAEIMGWSEESVRGIIHKHVDRAAATKAIIRKLDRRTD